MACGGIELDDTVYPLTSTGPSAWEDILVYDPPYPHDQETSFWDYAYGGFGGGSQGLIKPDVVAYTNVLTTSGPNQYVVFGGTSAATPAPGRRLRPAAFRQPGRDPRGDLPGPAGDGRRHGGAGQGLGVRGRAHPGEGRRAPADGVPAGGHVGATGRPPLRPLRRGLSRRSLRRRPLLVARGECRRPLATRSTRGRRRRSSPAASSTSRVARGVPVDLPPDEQLVGLHLHHQLATDNRRGRTGEFLFSQVETVRISSGHSGKKTRRTARTGR